ncbi:hypothetical protein [Tanapox virus]|uniref:Uncharacterized protein 151R n=1 Tax=Tanapox virus TaxID=99000 RepID=A7XC99_9POXV|nr:hypothetical protein [Tanapox virus]ABQ43627.1 hypothetical protein [Tanapox virus]ABQ43628.1 hypothetical protein [Tanapox virus]
MEVITDGVLRLKSFRDDFKGIKEELKFMLNSWEDSDILRHRQFIPCEILVLEKSERTKQVFGAIKRVLASSLTDYTVYVCEHLTIVKCFKGVGFDNRFSILTEDRHRGREYTLVLHLSSQKNGGKTDVCVGDKTVISTADDFLLEKRSEQLSNVVQEGEKIAVAVNVFLLRKEADVMFTLARFSKDVKFYEKEGDRNLCYALVEVNSPFAEVESFGVITDRSGRCLLVNRYQKLVKKVMVEKTFVDMCTEISFDGFYNLSNVEGKDMAWKELKAVKEDLWVPSSEEDYKFLRELVDYVSSNLKTKVEYYVLSTCDDDETQYVSLNVIRCYFSI